MREALRVVRAWWARHRREKSQTYAVAYALTLAAIAGSGAIWGWLAVFAWLVAGVVFGGVSGQKAERED